MECNSAFKGLTDALPNVLRSLLLLGFIEFMWLFLDRVLLISGLSGFGKGLGHSTWRVTAPASYNTCN
jgi:hypothetical protein